MSSSAIKKESVTDDNHCHLLPAVRPLSNLDTFILDILFLTKLMHAYQRASFMLPTYVRRVNYVTAARVRKGRAGEAAK